MGEKTAQFRFIKHQILDAEIHIANPDDISKNLNVRFGYTKNMSDKDGDVFILGMEAIITDNNKNLSIDIKAKGFFEFDKGLEEKLVDMFTSINAPAILFPYIRAYIGTLTALSGIAPLVLPTLNLSERK